MLIKIKGTQNCWAYATYCVPRFHPFIPVFTVGPVNATRLFDTTTQSKVEAEQLIDNPNVMWWLFKILFLWNSIEQSDTGTRNLQQVQFGAKKKSSTWDGCLWNYTLVSFDESEFCSVMVFIDEHGWNLPNTGSYHNHVPQSVMWLR